MTKATKTTPSVSETMKQLLAHDSSRIALDDFVGDHVRAAIASLGLERFPTSAPVTADALPRRLQEYEAAVQDLLIVVLLLGRWARKEQLRVLRKVFSRLSAADKGSGGSVLWLRLNWYPLQLLAYVGGIAALEAENYDALTQILLAPCHCANSPSGEEKAPLVRRVADEMTHIADAFKSLPGRDREFVPNSEYLYALLRNPLSNALYLDADYESLFDRFEVLSALIYADLTREARGGVWAPVGRFGWKFARGRGIDPCSEVIGEIEKQKDSWPLLKTGLFAGKSNRASEIAKEFSEWLGNLHWW